MLTSGRYELRNIRPVVEQPLNARAVALVIKITPCQSRGSLDRTVIWTPIATIRHFRSGVLARLG